MKNLPFALLICAGCAGPIETFCSESAPAAYTVERPTVPFHVVMTDSRGIDSWTGDGAPTVLTVKNPTSTPLMQLHVVCEPSVSPTYIDFGHIEWWTCVRAHRQKMRLVEFMNVDALHQVCRVAEQWPTTPGACIEDAQ